jgi:hypothetical protein
MVATASSAGQRESQSGTARTRWRRRHAVPYVYANVIPGSGIAG